MLSLQRPKSAESTSQFTASLHQDEASRVEARASKLTAQQEMTRHVEEDVLGLEVAAEAKGRSAPRSHRRADLERRQREARQSVPIHHIKLMQMIQCTEQLRGVKPRPLLLEPPLILQMVEQLPTIDITEDEVKLLGALERRLEGHDEGRSDLSENGTLGEGVNDFGARDDVRFADRFEGVDAHSTPQTEQLGRV
jgi:hypothetical protein